MAQCSICKEVYPSEFYFVGDKFIEPLVCKRCASEGAQAKPESTESKTVAQPLTDTTDNTRRQVRTQSFGVVDKRYSMLRAMKTVLRIMAAAIGIGGYLASFLVAGEDGALSGFVTAFVSVTVCVAYLALAQAIDLLLDLAANMKSCLAGLHARDERPESTDSNSRCT